MSETSTGRAYPLLVTLHTIEPGAFDEGTGYAEGIAIATPVMRLWCFKHGANHQIRITDVERIVYTLTHLLVTDDHLDINCPLDIAVISREIGYVDLIERGVESRSQVDACWQE